MSASRRRLGRAAGAALGLVAALAAGCGRGGPGGHGEMVVNVVVFASRQQAVQERVPLVGTLEANEAVALMSELDGTVETVRFEEGQPVAAEDVLLEFDRGKLRASLAAAVAELQAAEARLARYQHLVDSGAVSRQELDDAAAARERLSAAADLAQEHLRDAVVRAPFDGAIGERLVSPGQFVTRGEPLAWVVDLDPIKAEFRVPERYLGRLKPGQSVDVRVAAYDKRFTGEVTFVDPQVDEATRTVLVKAAIPNPDGALRRGMFANLDLILQVRPRAVVIPESALLLRGETASVFVVEEDVAQPREVTAGLRLPGFVEIASGLKPGELVVVEGTQKLRPGASVKTRVAEEPPAPPPFGPPSPMGSGG
jgi:membrane fusion protein (multidrug efflux system)